MHSVIGQGKVEAIVLSKPRERRMLIEEAAGLGKHRKRRRRAQLKLERTRSNLDRALDVEREARSRLRPLRQQANAAETHARLERQSLELQLRLLGDRLAAGGGDLATAEAAARTARDARDGIEAKLAEANERRSKVEQRLAERDRERTAVWGELTALRAAHERLGARTESIAGREAELRAAVERRRAALGTLATELRATERDAEVALASELESARDALAEASTGIAAALEAGDVESRLNALARVRNGSERATRSARRAEDMLGHRRQDSLQQRVESEAELAETLAGLCAALAGARDAVGARASAVEERVVGAQAGDELALELRDCSRVEAELHGELRLIAERVTEAEVRAASLRDRREEAEAEWERILAGLELDPAPEPSATGGCRAGERRGLDRAPDPPPRAARAGQPACRGRVRAGQAARRRARGPARGPRAGADRAGQADPPDRPRDHSRVRGDLRRGRRQLQRADRAPVPGRQRPAAAGRGAEARAGARRQPSAEPAADAGAEGGEDAEAAEEAEIEDEDPVDTAGVEIEVTPGRQGDPPPLAALRR